MSAFRTITPEFSVSPQISTADVAAAAAEGFALLVNNRPDGEAPGQPSGAAIEAAAVAGGLRYLHVPIVGAPSPEQVDAVARAIAEAPGPTLAFCRSGTRSIVTWALGQAAGGGLDRADLIRRGAAAGYDLSAVLPAPGARGPAG